MIDEARAKPGELKYGSAGVGSILHTTVELIGDQTKTKFLHVPYRGEAPALTGMLTGEIDFIAATTGPISPRVKSGEFRALAVTGKTRWRDFPDVPTVAEAAIPGFEVISWTGLAGPPNLPKPIVDRLNAEVRKALAVPDVKQKLEAMGGDPRATTPDEMKALVRASTRPGRARRRGEPFDQLGRVLRVDHVGRAIDELQGGAVGIAEIRPRPVDRAAAPIFLEEHVDALRAQAIHRSLIFRRVDHEGVVHAVRHIQRAFDDGAGR